jgi:hypothetical protein
MARAGFEPTIPVLELFKTIGELERTTTGTGIIIIISYHRFSFPWYFSWTNSAPHYLKGTAAFCTESIYPSVTTTTTTTTTTTAAAAAAAAATTTTIEFVVTL